MHFQLPHTLLLCDTDHSNTLQTHTLAGSDYIVSLQDFAARDFTVTFLSKQANSTEHVIFIADDQIFEGREYFRLRLSAVNPIGQAAQFFIPQADVTNTYVDVVIADDDSKSSSSAFHKCVQNYIVQM